ncbi:metallophosphoesterase family protein [Paenibacillus flagellatus]|uniref:Phosphoesterase n=1 Tax=Paenibacillus flagellatus TaxID=2211139 RepID=A0A2V5K9B2_9BACL|nr:metallophosphoesterase [Paenibacillus flagellatus]PYI55422.1 YfcE family phosphodiesterase [Paenibacillus flagellatus]
MIVGVVSDTHMPARARKLPSALVEGLKGADLILHAGDWVSSDVCEELAQLAPIEGVYGNGDGGDIVSRFGARKTLDLDGVRVGLVHGHEGPGRTTPERALFAFREELPPDVIVFGHSHVPLLEQVGGTTLFNPGSPTDKRRQPLYSYGILTIRGGTFTAEHRFFADRD